MLNYYPANRLENLVSLIDAIIAQPKENILASDIVLTQNKGMQHWLNMEIAKKRGIAMNIDYQLPAQFIWQVLNQLLLVEQESLGNNAAVPSRNDYAREVLSWRLYQLLADERFINDPLAKEPTQYWLKDGKSDTLKRWQLAQQQADLFDQYIIYRPDWLLNWQQGELPTSHPWQAKLWQLLISQQPITPLAIFEQAKSLIGTFPECLPERIFVFGINALPPIWMEFFSSLAEHTQVHLLHLNPCVQYWGDIQTEKQLAKWLTSAQAEPIETSDAYNPLLANLGQQGREFLQLLPEYHLSEIAVFEEHGESQSNNNKALSALAHIQDDILTLNDARKVVDAKTAIDDSIVFTCAHSALREVQGLHDYLLHQFNQDPELTPKDVLVMCPQIEDYAPYIESVFIRSWDEYNEKIPPLPCSIADRVMRNLEPVVETFMQLLQLPDSRFSTTELLSYLRLPAIAHKFEIDEEELKQIETWLVNAGIHWGLDSDHKGRTLSKYQNDNLPTDSKANGQESNTLNNKFTWQGGLDRLLLGFAYSDSCEIYQNNRLLPDVEGQDALLLGKLMALLERLTEHVRLLNQSRTAKKWHQYLKALAEDFFSQRTNDEEGLFIVADAIEQLSLYTGQAHFDEPLDLVVVKTFLNDHFNQSDPGRQFLTGQVTFCSMIPMRSIPFKLICILGLNDGEFPRQKQPLGFDLIAQNPARAGDRSRRHDDRYLFLEALISARKALYISYQGKSIKDNSDREPSIIVKELQDYLAQGYGWQFEKQNLVRNLPLQPFSLRNYTSFDAASEDCLLTKWPSFAPQWLKLSQPTEDENQNHLFAIAATDANNTSDKTIDKALIEISLNDLVAFFDKPVERFAALQLGLRDNDQSQALLEDEPFSPSSLDKYQLSHEFLAAVLEVSKSDETSNEMACAISDIKAHALLSDKLPDTPSITDDLNTWQSHAENFANSVSAATYSQTTSVQGELIIGDYLIKQELSFFENQQVLYRLTSAKAKDYFNLWLHHLFAQATQATQPDQTKVQLTTLGLFYKEQLKNPIQEIRFDAIEPEQAVAHLQDIIEVFKLAQQQAIFIPTTLGNKVFTKTDRQKKPLPFEQTDLEKLWLENDMNNRDVIRFFYEQVPNLSSDIMPHLTKVYLPLYQALNPKLSSFETFEKGGVNHD